MSKIIRSRLFMVGMAVILVAGLVIGFTLPGLAKDNGKATPVAANAPLVNIVTGNVTSLADDKLSFEIEKNGTPLIIKVDNNTKYFAVSITPKTPLPDIKLKVPPPIKIPQIDNKIEDKDIQRGLGAKKGQSEAAKPPLPPVNKDNIQKEKNNPNNFAAQEDLAKKKLRAEIAINKKIQVETTIIEDPEMAVLAKQFVAAMESSQGLINKIPSLFGRVHQFGKKATFDDIRVKDRIIARVMPNENLAKEVLIIKSVPPPSLHPIKKINGTVTLGENNSLTITPAEGSPVILTWDSDTQFILKGLIAVANEQQASASYNSNTLKAMVVHVSAAVP